MKLQDEALSVTQADRDAAADLLDELSGLLDHVGIGQVADLIRDGEYDEHEAVEHFKRHRLSHSTPGDAEVRKATEELAAFATLLERPPLDDVEIEAKLSVRIAASIRTLLATPSGRAQAWLPIETAPKDGTHFLACDARRPYDQWWGFNQSPPYVVHYWSGDDPGFYLSRSDDGAGMTPTHWQPFAAPPAQDQTKGDEA